jgi:pyrroloquinoline quinone (PQQ) biosynthesis protein C
MGLNKKEVLEDPYLPAARAINDFCHKIFIDGSIIELWGLHVFEESVSMWSGQWFTALTTHYGFSKADAVYFSTHEEAEDTHKLSESGRSDGPIILTAPCSPARSRTASNFAPAIRWNTVP